jgi:hypothetical protein
MNRIIAIPNVTALLVECWAKAEKQTREGLRKRFHDKDEEFVTELFHGEFRAVVDTASRAGSVKQAFCRDLEAVLPNPQNSSDVKRLASGISATVTLHSRKVEGRTGGDIGLVLIRPNINSHPIRKEMLIVDQHYSRGLLCQAKIKRRFLAGRKALYGGLSSNQRKVPTNRAEYLALLLYEYDDPERHNLLPFKWQICTGVNLKDIGSWLKSGVFPSLSNSEKIIRQLADGKIGTGQKDIIEQLIAPAVRSSLVIRIGWPPGKGPPSNFLLRMGILQNQTQAQLQHLKR